MTSSMHSFLPNLWPQAVSLVEEIAGAAFVWGMAWRICKDQENKPHTKDWNVCAGNEEKEEKEF